MKTPRFVKLTAHDGTPVIVNAERVLFVGQGSDGRTGRPVVGTVAMFLDSVAQPLAVKGSCESVAAILNGETPPDSPAAPSLRIDQRDN